MPIPPQYPIHFAKRRFIRSHVPQPEGNGHHVELFVAKRQRQPIGRHQLCESAPARDREHRQAEIGTNETCSRILTADFESKRATAGSHVENRGRLPGSDLSPDMPPPQRVHPKTEQRVRQIISWSNPRKHPLDTVRLFLSEG